jgi:hypothetical protein
MTMTRQLWTLNALATQLGRIDECLAGRGSPQCQRCPPRVISGHRRADYERPLYP